MSTATITRAVLAAEMPAVTAWASRRGWTIEADAPSLRLSAATVHPVVQTVIVFCADLTGYPATPPAWTCLNGTGHAASAAFPVAGSRAGLSGSIFHPNGVICAPWNRLAYAVHGGPHNDWGDLTGWKTVTGGVTQAHTLADMLTTLALHLSASRAIAA
ncbi:hypothetical protein [Mycobacterium sp. SA01]|uniref:hypothetical protein n=1 Tax=Mycobacterium sp. SA01 TaxID=3238820 RepID=UPI00351B5926